MAGVHPDTIGSLLHAQAALGDSLFLVADQRQITYAEVEHRSRQLATVLLHNGVGRGSHVALLFGNSPDFVIGFMAVTRIGAIAIPFSTLSTAGEVRGLLRGADVEYLIAATDYHGRDLRQVLSEAIDATLHDSRHEPLLLPALPTLRRVWLGIDELMTSERVNDAQVSAAEAQVSPADTLAMVHTSGSTSAPKGVLHSHGQVIRNMRRQNALRQYSGADRLFSNSPFFWIGGLAYSLLATWIAGARLICSSAKPGDMLDLLEAQRPTMCNGVASTVLALAREPDFARRDLSSLRRGNLYPIMPAEVRPADPELRCNLLGATETGSVSLWGPGDVDLAERKRGTFGRPVPGIEARVVDPETGQDASEGELWVRGPNVMQGYYNRERGDTFDAEAWFHTGDMMRIDEDGDFYFKGRGGDIIRTAGAQVSPREVEAAISDVTGGRMAIVVGVPDPERGQRVTAVMVGGAALDTEALQAALKQRLSPYKVPRRFVLIEAAELPTLSSGKVDLRKLVELVRDR